MDGTGGLGTYVSCGTFFVFNSSVKRGLSNNFPSSRTNRSKEQHAVREPRFCHAWFTSMWVLNDRLSLKETVDIWHFVLAVLCN
jgi:hypothetical protein